MKKRALALTLAFASLGAAQAQSFVQVDPAQPKPLRFVVGAGFTFGGDKLATAYYENDIELDIRGGDGLVLLAGLDYRLSPQFSVQGTVGYHLDRAPATNGGIHFSRIPLELLGYYHVNEKLRVGGGLRLVTNTRFDSSGVSEVGDFSFDDSASVVAELEYMYSHRMGLKLRWVNDAFKGPYGYSVKGDHVGVLANFYF